MPIANSEGYAQAARGVWRRGSRGGADAPALERELVRFATLAPSSHNTQCWKFRVEDQGITILPDFTRRCPAVDPDDHHLFVSLGCAAENLIQAALASGLHGEAVFDATTSAIQVTFAPTRAVCSPLFLAIPARQSTRAEYDGRPLSTEELTILENTGSGNGVQVMLLTEHAAMEQVLEYVVQGNTIQLSDHAFVEELKAWIRFNVSEAEQTGDGLYSATTGNPSVPSWLGRRFFRMLVRASKENKKCVKHVRSSAGIAIFTSDGDDAAHWIEVGRCVERFALQSTALGVRTAFLNQPVEVSALRRQFSDSLGLGDRRPDLVVRFGRGTAMPRSLRRPVNEVLVRPTA